MSEELLNETETPETPEGGEGEVVSPWISENRRLSYTEMQQNADIIIARMRAEGWTDNAIAALLSNTTAESTINPGRWEGGEINYSRGFGLVQWTPATKLFTWIFDTYGNEDYSNGDYQLDRIIWELNNGVQFYKTVKYPLTFYEWTRSTKPPGYLAAAFMVNYERPKNQTPPNQRARGNTAEYWWRYITGDSEDETPVSVYPFGVINRRRRMRRRKLARR